MAAMDWVAHESGDRAQVYGACAGCAGARALPSRRPVKRNTVSSQRASHAARGKSSSELDFRPRLTEWVADLALAEQAALGGPDWASRMVMF